MKYLSMELSLCFLCSYVLLQLHAALSVLLGVANFNDCSDARKELLEEIKEARADLTKRKVL